MKRKRLTIFDVLFWPFKVVFKAVRGVLWLGFRILLMPFDLLGNVMRQDGGAK